MTIERLANSDALIPGLARMIDDGLLGDGDVDADAATALAAEVTDVLGVGLVPSAG